MQTRKATAADADAVYLLACEAAGQTLPREVFARIFETGLSSSRRCVAVAVANDAVCAFAELEAQYTLSACALQGVIHTLYVTPAARGGKTGTALLIFLLAQARAMHCAALSAAASRVDVRAAAFLERNGFVRSTNLYTHTLLK